MSLTGSRFQVTTNGLTVQGRVLLDVLDPIRRRVLADSSHLRFFQEALLVQALTSDGVPLGDSLFVGREALEDGRWEVLDRRPVRPEELEFPLGFVGRRRDTLLVRGEVGRVVEVPPDVDPLDLPGLSMFASDVFPQVAALHLGQPIPGGRSPGGLRRALGRGDLRATEGGRARLAQFGETLEQRYHELAADCGHDVSRLLGQP